MSNGQSEKFQKEEFDEGWELAIKDHKRDLESRFNENHSEFAKGYQCGYVFAMCGYVEEK